MADSYLGFENTTEPSQIGINTMTIEAPPEPYPTQVLVQTGDTIRMEPGTTTPSSVTIDTMPAITSLYNRTFDIEYLNNTTTITGDLEVDEDLLVSGDIQGQDITATADIYATNNISAVTANLQGIRINPHNTAPFSDNIVLNQNIQVGVSDNGTYNALDAPDIELYPKNFSIGGLLPTPYPARTIELVGIEIPITATVNMNLAAPLITIEAADTNVVGILSVQGDANVTGILAAQGDVNITGVLDVQGAADVTGALGVQGGGDIAGGLAVQGGMNVSGVVGIEGATTVTGALTVVGVTSAVGFGTLVPPLPINSFTVVSAGAVTLSSALGVAITGTGVTITSGLTQMTGGLNVANTLNVTDISGVATINGAAYPPGGGSGGSTWSQFPATQNVTIPSQYTLLTNTLQGNGNASTSIINVNSPLNMGNLPLQLTNKITSGNNAGFLIEANTLSVTGFNNSPVNVSFNAGNLTGVSQINGAAYPPLPSQWAVYNAVQNVTIPAPLGLNTNNIGPASGTSIALSGGLNVNSNPITGVTTINGQAYPPPAGNASAWSTYPATQAVSMASQSITNMGPNIATSISGFNPLTVSASGALSLTGNTISMSSGNALNITGSPLTLTGVTSINGNPYPIPVLIGFTPLWTSSASPLIGSGTIPPNVTGFDLIMIGGGGGGGGSASFINNAGGGGGSGYIRTAMGISVFANPYYPTQPYTNYNFSIGAGGAGGASGGGVGIPGTQTIFRIFNQQTALTTRTWKVAGGNPGGGATGGVNDGGGPGGSGGAGGGGGWRRSGGGAAGGGTGQWNGTQNDNGFPGRLSDQAIGGGAGGDNQFGTLPVTWSGGGFAATGGVGGGYLAGYSLGTATGTPSAGNAADGWGGGGGGQNSDGSGGNGAGNGGNGAIGNVWIRWYFQ